MKDNLIFLAEYGKVTITLSPNKASASLKSYKECLYPYTITTKPQFSIKEAISYLTDMVYKEESSLSLLNNIIKEAQ